MINRHQAIEFLKLNQPLPDDALLEKDIAVFKEVEQYFANNPDPACVPLFLNCFGDGSGYGRYQIIEDLILKYDGKLVVSHLKQALFSQYSSVRYWCSQISQNYTNNELIDGLINAFKKGDIDTKCAALTALTNYDDNRVITISKAIVFESNDDDLLEIATDILNK